MSQSNTQLRQKTLLQISLCALVAATFGCSSESTAGKSSSSALQDDGGAGGAGAWDDKLEKCFFEAAHYAVTQAGLNTASAPPFQCDSYACFVAVTEEGREVTCAGRDDDGEDGVGLVAMHTGVVKIVTPAGVGSRWQTLRAQVRDAGGKIANAVTPGMVTNAVSAACSVDAATGLSEGTGAEGWVPLVCAVNNVLGDLIPGAQVAAVETPTDRTDAQIFYASSLDGEGTDFVDDDDLVFHIVGSSNDGADALPAGEGNNYLLPPVDSAYDQNTDFVVLPPGCN